MEERSENLAVGRQVMHTTIPCMLTVVTRFCVGVQAGETQVNCVGLFAFVLNTGARPS